MSALFLLVALLDVVVTVFGLSELDALTAAYNSFSAAGTRNVEASLSSWRVGIARGVLCSGRESSWYGVTCNAAGKVSELNLRSRALRGPVPAEIGALTQLVNLDLSRNELSGTISAAVVVGSISSILLNNNRLSGSVPSSFCLINSTSATIYIDANRLIRSYPACLHRYSNFVHDSSALALWPTGQPTGQPTFGPSAPSGQPTAQPTGLPLALSVPRPVGIPTGQPTRQPSAQPTGQPSAQPSVQPSAMSTAMSELAALMALRASWISCGTATLSTWTGGSSAMCSSWEGISCNTGGAVESITLPRYGLCGRLLPTAIASLRFLKALSLPSNLLTGVLPSQLFTLPRLLTLNLAYNSFNVTSFPDSLGLRLAPLRELNLSGIDNLVVGSIPFTLCGFKSLTSLDLGTNPSHLTCLQPCLVTAAAAAGNTINLPTCQTSQVESLSSLFSVIFAGYRSYGRGASESLELTQEVLVGWDEGIRNGIVCVAAATTWRGVTCDSSEIVTGLDLSALSLPRMQLPAASMFAGLSAGLTRLSLASNSFTKTIPSALTVLTRLQELRLEGNRWTGSIPSTFAALSSLTLLDVSSAFLTGSIPEQLSLLTSLVALDVSNNKLTSSLPASLPKALTKLCVARNPALTGALPSTIGQLTALRHLDVSNTQLDGSLPGESLGLLTSLTWLDMSSTLLSSSLPTQLGMLTLLQSLALYNCRFSGVIPNELGDLAALDSLYLNENKFVGSVPDTFCKLLDSTLVAIEGNYLIVNYPSCLDGLAQFTKNDGLTTTNAQETADGEILCELYASAPAQGQALLTNWCGSKYSRGGFLDSPCGTLRPWRGVACAPLNNVARVSVLDLAGLGLGGGSLPDSFSRLAGLTWLDLSQNALGSTIPLSWGLLTQLASLALDSNHLIGSIPSTFGGDMTKLERLWLNDNSIEGPIPKSLGGAVALTELYLNRNKLTGGVPSSLCRPAANSAAPPFFLYVSDNTGLFCVFSHCLFDNKNFLMAVESASVVICPTDAPTAIPTTPPTKAAELPVLSPVGIAVIVVGCAILVAVSIWTHDWWARRAAKRLQLLKVAAADHDNELDHDAEAAKLYYWIDPAVDPDVSCFIEAQEKAAAVLADAAAALAVAEAEAKAEAEAAAAAAAAEEKEEPSPPTLAPELLGFRLKMETRMRQEMAELQAGNEVLRQKLDTKRDISSQLHNE